MRTVLAVPFPALVLSTLLSFDARADIVASTADDVCSPAANPCVIAERVQVVSGSTLDFGPRALVVQGSGRFDFGSGSADVLAGSITLGGGGVSAATGGSNGRGGAVAFEARRACSNAPATACLDDEDCDGGTCSVGQGTLTLNSSWAARTATPGSASLTAADDVVVAATMNLSGSTADSDGGSVDLYSTFASVKVSSAVTLSSGSVSSGGAFTAEAALDVILSAAVDCTGGDFDGGEILVAAGRDVLVTNDLNCNATSGAGGGGSIELVAGRDLTLAGGTQNNRTDLSVLGKGPNDGFGGDGGEVALVAGRDLTVGRFARVLSAGARPDGVGGQLSLDAGGNILVEGIVAATADGADGSAGTVDATATGGLTVAATATLSVAGGDVGTLDLRADGPIDLGGTVDLSGSSNAFSGMLLLVGSSEVKMRGTMTANRPDTALEITGCDVTFETGSDYFNNVVGGVNNVVGRERIRVLAGGALRTRASGQNTLTYRTAEKPPLIQGTVTPAPVLVIDPELPVCSVCGNGEVEEGETCDDGNKTGGDGCSADCQLETCIAQTAGGYPDNPLCHDDDPCTDDICNMQTGNCEHVDLCATTTTTTSTTTTTMLEEIVCGDANGNGIVQANDALIALRTAVGSATCPLVRCDVNNNGAVQAGDALAILRKAVGQPIELDCPAA